MRFGAVRVQAKRFSVELDRPRWIPLGQLLVGAVGDDRRLVLALAAGLAFPEFRELLLRRFGFVQATQHVAELEADIGIVRVQTFRLFQMLTRLLQGASAHQDEAEVIAHVAVARIQSVRAAQGTFGFFGPAQLSERDALDMASVEFPEGLGASVQVRSRRRQGVSVLVLTHQDLRQRQVGLGMLGVDPECPTQCSFGICVPLLPGVERAQVEMRDGRSRVHRRRFLQGLRGLLDETRFAVRDAETELDIKVVREQFGDLAEMGDRRFRLARRSPGTRQRLGSLHGPGIEFLRREEFGGGGFVSTRFCQRGAVRHAPRKEVRRVDAQAPEVRHGRRKITLLDESQA